MENGTQNGARTNHERDTVNGVNGAVIKPQLSPEKLRGLDDRAKAGSLPAINGASDGATHIEVPAPKGGSATPSMATNALRIQDLPDEIQHITTGIMPLSLLLSRLAQISHNHLQELVAELSTRPIAPAAVNGITDHRNANAEDTSPDSIEKKRMLLSFVQDLHAKWVKALVITEWSRKAELVGKLIDLKGHLQQQLDHFPGVMWEMANVKRDLIYARLPSPDLKTALQVLSSGEISWMPELNFIEPAPLTAQEQLDWIDNLNTILSVRLSLDEHDKIPYHFRNYTVSSGRVTFRVEDEFEVDLTIADEDFEKQFWFIDFRFIFSPAPAELSEGLRTFLETKVNDVLGTDGLQSCYHFLHEFVLTHKITEFTRQAVELGRGRWVESLRVDRLNRAMAIQYWVNRPTPGLKSWIILGVNSGTTTGGSQDAKSTSHLSLRWFRDNKEVKTFDISLDVDEISTERLLKTVIARHVEYILSTIHSKLLTYPRFTKREASLSLSVSETEPLRSELVMRLSHADSLTARIDPVTGSFSFSPHSRIVLQGERKINAGPKDPVEDGFAVLEKARCSYAAEELHRRGKSMGWTMLPPPVKPDELKPMINNRDAFQMVWLQRHGWKPDWFVLVTMSLSGDCWWLVEVTNPAAVRRLKTFTKVTLTSGQPELSDTFFQNLTIFLTGMISQITDLRELHSRRIKYAERENPNYALPPQMKLPAVYVKLSEIVPSLTPKKGSKKPWALDFVQILFKGAQKPVAPRRSAGSGQLQNNAGIGVVAEARLTVTDRSKFSLLKGNVDHDVYFNPRAGQFALRLRTEAGKSIIETLTTRLQAIGRLVDFVDAMRRRGKSIVCESVTLRQVVFTYGDGISPLAPNNGAQQEPRRWRVKLDLTSSPRLDVTLEKGNPHLRILDILKQLASSSAMGLGQFPFWLNLTLPLLRGIEVIETSWAKVAMDDAGSVEIFHKSLDHLTMRFKLPGATPAQQRQLALNLRLHVRRGEQWWHISRDAARSSSDAEFSKALKPVWEGHGADWKGLGTGAAARPMGGIELLLAAIDAALLAMVGGSSAATVPPAKPAGVVPRPHAGGQGQGQGNRGGMRGGAPVVVID